MRTDTPAMIRLEDYRPSDFLVDAVELHIELHPSATRVRSTLSLRPNSEGLADAPLVLDGDELTLSSILLDEAPLPPSQFTATPQSLTIPQPPGRAFSLTIETVVEPTANTKLMGLYRSNGVYCTQCEADGFRRITYMLDRPDVLAVYTTRIAADREDAPVLLGNGNLLEAGEQPDGRHFALWHDPFPKPCYLFAIVGGRLDMSGSTFVTASGRPVALAVYVEPGKADRAGYALDALARSMRWDEEVFGREYDLDVFNVVAVSDFNMGAMENKGLNIFNDKYVLASPDTATDTDYAGIEAVIAHEYFHNWTGNRITCRDWFQLCLKEGLTVFRDQEFSSDMRSRAVHRIGEVRTLRARQFTEDAGPLAHAVRPKRYREINNFYTATVYEKGAEIVRMLKALIGPDAFRSGMNLYFERFDGTAATVEDFLSCFTETSGRDLTHFSRWYDQAGTPCVTINTNWDEGAGRYTLHLRQATPPTPGQTDKQPLVIPLLLDFTSTSGGALPLVHSRTTGGLFVLDRDSDMLVFDDVPERPIPSILRGFSAPIRLELDLDEADQLALLRNDTDPFVRWEAAQTIGARLIVEGSLAHREPDGTALSEALGRFLIDEARRDPAFAALVLSLPSELEVAQQIGRTHDVDPDAIHMSREALRRQLGTALLAELHRLWHELAERGPFSPDASAAGRRSLRATSLDLMAAGDPRLGEELAADGCRDATNMTDRLASLGVLSRLPGEARERALSDFEIAYAHEPLVLDKWFALQATIPEPGTLGRIERLRDHPGFSLVNPNRVRSLIGAFAMSNPTQFNRTDGAGYGLLADTVLALNNRNPQVAARLLTAFGSWRALEPVRRSLAQSSLSRIAAAPDLSPDVFDIVSRSLAG